MFFLMDETNGASSLFIFYELLEWVPVPIPSAYEDVYPNGVFTKQIQKAIDDEIDFSGLIFCHPLFVGNIYVIMHR